MPLGVYVVRVGLMVTDDVFAVIAEATRRDILVSLQAGDKAVGELVEELAASQPTISKHLKVLREADLVSMRAQGQKRYYALNPKPLQNVAAWLGTFDLGPVPTTTAAPATASTVTGSEQTASEAGQSEALVSAPAGSPEAALAATASSVPGTPGSGSALAARSGLGAGAGLAAARAAMDDSVPQQIGRTVGRAATRAADLLASLPKVPKVSNLPKFGRKK